MAKGNNAMMLVFALVLCMSSIAGLVLFWVMYQDTKSGDPYENTPPTPLVVQLPAATDEAGRIVHNLVQQVMQNLWTVKSDCQKLNYYLRVTHANTLAEFYKRNYTAYYNVVKNNKRVPNMYDVLNALDRVLLPKLIEVLGACPPGTKISGGYPYMFGAQPTTEITTEMAIQKLQARLMTL